jgi:putative membrane protein
MSRLLIVAAAGSLAIAAGAGAIAAQPMNSPAAATPTTRDAFVAMAGASDLYEIRSSQMAQKQSRNAAVRDFAGMMIRDHNSTTKQVVAAARSAGMSPPPPALTPMQQDMLDRLKGKSGADFDREYLSQQVQAHQMALALHQNYAANGDTPALRQVASAVPIVQAHYDRVRQLASGA